MPVVEVGGQPAVLALLGLVDPAEQPAPLGVGIAAGGDVLVGPDEPHDPPGLVDDALAADQDGPDSAVGADDAVLEGERGRVGVGPLELGRDPLDVGRVDDLDDARRICSRDPGGRPMIRLISSEMVSSSLARSHSQLPICAIRWASASWRRLASNCRSARRSSVTSRAITMPPITAPRSSGRGT